MPPLDNRLAAETIGLRAEVGMLKAHKALLLKACHAAVEYDKAIRSCANEPEKMASFCTAQGQNLDDLYRAWINAARKAIYETGG